MEIQVRVHHPLAAAGLPLRVEVRDTSLADAAAVTIAAGEALLTEAGETTVPLDIPEEALAAAELSVFAHAGPDPAWVAAGDYLTVQHYPVSAAVPVVEVEVVLIG